MIGREGRGPERPGPDYPPEWDNEPAWPWEQPGYDADRDTRLAAIEAAPAAPESWEQRVEAAARVIWNEGGWCGECDHFEWAECAGCHEDCVRYAAAALTADAATTHRGAAVTEPTDRDRETAREAILQRYGGEICTDNLLVGAIAAALAAERARVLAPILALAERFSWDTMREPDWTGQQVADAIRQAAAETGEVQS